MLQRAGAVREDYGGHGGGRAGVNDHTLPSMAQAVVDGLPNMGHAPGLPVGALTD